jgi:hypothetical protein
MMWIIRKYLDRYRAWASHDILSRVAPVHGEMGDVTVYGKTVYECAKRWLDTQELTL